MQCVKQQLVLEVRQSPLERCPACQVEQEYPREIQGMYLGEDTLQDESGDVHYMCSLLFMRPERRFLYFWSPGKCEEIRNNLTLPDFLGYLQMNLSYIGETTTTICTDHGKGKLINHNALQFTCATFQRKGEILFSATGNPADSPLTAVCPEEADTDPETDPNVYYAIKLTAMDERAKSVTPEMYSCKQF
eukprot:TRINITY_DN1133_c1_g2_i7.p2 TRINITY_DN1133_c1_g2~~TRINITY_DN1133_c1_g2_i7.p2  ORF type:complete len:190 (-),score=22.34 TRINITY_DN1133_c1_g2_i7:1191-1760(-)